MKKIVLVFIFITQINAQQSYIDYVSPYHPVLSSKGMVVSQNSLSSDIGRDILNMGGNAVDAAVAVGFSLTTTLPRAGNLGGGGFMLVYIKERNENENDHANKRDKHVIAFMKMYTFKY